MPSLSGKGVTPLGHANLETTNYYAQANLEKKRSACRSPSVMTVWICSFVGQLGKLRPIVNPRLQAGYQPAEG